ncbi:exopolygalacturonase-like [Chenopodium quinoa]|uniref:exopolygalacturonase-like n=1 Tax=Chenopodium quinoa TaxID=63459 RepID=UPI000B76E8AD|nr:exopolygalacturonase-like [Chenopodium quinoa]
MSRISTIIYYFLIYAIFANTFYLGNSTTLQHGNGIIINVRSFRVRADGRSDDSWAFNAAWEKACNSKGNVTLLIPKGTYLVGPLKLRGPCEQVTSLTVLLKGTLKAKTDLSEYEFGSGWIEFAWINGLTLTGGGVFDGQGAKAWPYNTCPTSSNCDLLPTNLKFVGMNRTTVHDITSLNSKFFHLALVECRDFEGSKLEILAPEDSPNTDGIHLERSSNVRFSWLNIGTGDDCISVRQGNSQISITNITCGPGHGISVGSLGKYLHEQDINGLFVRNCTISGTTNGIRIKTWANSPGRSAATNIKFENIVMKHVRNPIIIDQAYCPFDSCSSEAPSRVRLSNIYFKNIRGTSLSEVAVTLSCSKGIPCKNIFLQNVHLNLTSGERLPVLTCENVKARYIGIQMPPPCP